MICSPHGFTNLKLPISNYVHYIKNSELNIATSDTASGWAGWASAHLEFGSSVNPIPTRGGADYAHHITACPPGFENPAASLRLHMNLKWRQ